MKKILAAIVAAKKKILAAIVGAGVTIVGAVAIYFAISIVPPDALAFAPSLVSPDTITFLVVAGTVISEAPLIYRSEIPPLLKAELGIVLGKSTIAKLFSPAIGQGCEPACYWNKRPLYRRADVLAWAKSRLRPGPGMTAMSEEADIPAKGGSEPAAHTTSHEESITAA